MVKTSPKMLICGEVGNTGLTPALLAFGVRCRRVPVSLAFFAYFVSARFFEAGVWFLQFVRRQFLDAAVYAKLHAQIFMVHGRGLRKV